MVIFGRDRELEQISRCTEQAIERSRSVIITGEAGIGKTSLVDAAVDFARSVGYCVLACRPSAIEQSFSFSGLADMFSGLSDAQFDTLPGPQRRAIDVALRRVSADGAPIDAGAVAFAATNLVAALPKPTAIFVDDIQWLDAASASIVDYLVRRLPASGVFVLVAQRSGELTNCAFVERPALLEVAYETIDLAPLKMPAIERLLLNHLGAPPTRATLIRIFKFSRGNPLFAIELANQESLHGAGHKASNTLFASLQRRLDQLPESVLEGLLTIAAMGRPTIQRVRGFLDPDDEQTAVHAGIIECVKGRWEFSHPLLLAAVYARASASELVLLHRLLAESSESVEERGHHLALATVGPDREIAAALDAAAEAALERGAPHIAYELTAVAVRATAPDDECYGSRCVRAAELRFQSGDAKRARVDLVEMLSGGPMGSDLRLQVLRLLAVVAYECDASASFAIECASLALEIAGASASAQVEMHALLARVQYHDFAIGLDHARAAVRIAEQHPELPASLVADAVLTKAMTGFLAGDGLDRSAYEKAALLEAELRQPRRLADSALAALAADLKYADEFDDARELLLDIYRRSLTDADESSRPYALSHLPQLELFTGDWNAAEGWARQHLAIAEETCQSSQASQARFNLALVDAFRGNVGPARGIALTDLQLAESDGDLWSIASLTGLLGFLAWSEADATTALRYFSTSWITRERMGLLEPGRSRFLSDHFETEIAVGNFDDVGALIAVVKRRARSVARPSALNAVGRGEGLLLAATGDHRGSERAFGEALDALVGVALPFEVARTHLSFGQTLRRAKAKRAALDHLQTAVDGFVKLGACRWADRAVAARNRAVQTPRGAFDLTDTERLVADLAASGRTTRQIAAAAFISPKTVEAHITRIYRKLGVSTRAGLATHIADAKKRETPPWS